MTCTYLKPRDRTDPESCRRAFAARTRRTAARIARAAQRRIIQSLDALLPRLDAVIVADQAEERDCGVVTAAVREALAEAARRCPKVVFWADSRRRIREFRGLIIKPNQFEAVGAKTRLPGDKVYPGGSLSRRSRRCRPCVGARSA